MNSNTRLLRQIAPWWFSKGKFSLQVFMPRPRDYKLLSVDNGDIINPEEKILELDNRMEKCKENTNKNLEIIKKQENKIESMKNMVKELDNQIDIQLKLKDKKANDKLEIFNKQSQEYINEIN